MASVFIFLLKVFFSNNDTLQCFVCLHKATNVTPQTLKTTSHSASLTKVWWDSTSSSVSRLKPSLRSSNRSITNTFACQQTPVTMTTQQQQQFSKQTGMTGSEWHNQFSSFLLSQKLGTWKAWANIDVTRGPARHVWLSHHTKPHKLGLSSALTRSRTPDYMAFSASTFYMLHGIYQLILTLWRPLFPYGYSYKASCARLG